MLLFLRAFEWAIMDFKILKRVFRKPYYIFLRFFYKFDYFLNFAQRRYVYRLVTCTPARIPRALEENQIISYLESRLISDFKSGKISEHGIGLLLESARKAGSIELHCVFSRVLFESRTVSTKFVKFDHINNCAILEILSNRFESGLGDFFCILRKGGNPSWTSSFVYRLIGGGAERTEWGLVNSLSAFYMAANNSNIFVNKSYLISCVHLLRFSTLTELFVSEPFKSLMLADQISLVELFLVGGSDNLFHSCRQHDADTDFYFSLFQRLIIPEGERDMRQVYPAGKVDGFRFVEICYKEKFLFGAKLLSRMENISSDFLGSYPSLQKIYSAVREYDGGYGGSGWAEFLENIHELIFSSQQAESFDKSFLELIGYSQKKIMLSHDSALNITSGPIRDFTILVCNSRLSKKFFAETYLDYDFAHVVAYSSVAQTEIDPSLCSVVSISDLVPQPGSPLDMEAYQIAHEVSLDFFSKIVCAHGVSEWSEKFIREVFSLAIEDRLFGHIKRLIVLIDHIRSSKARRVILSYKLQEYKLMYALARAIHLSLGIECILLREYGRFDVSRHCGCLSGQPSSKVSFFEYINKFESFRFCSETLERDSLLLLSSLGDAAYYKSAVQILRASNYSVNYVFNLGDRFVAREFLSNNVHLVDASGLCSFDSPGICFVEFEGVRVAVFDEADKLFPYSELIQYVFDLYVLKWVAKLNNQIDAILSFFESRSVSSLLTIPGRAPVSRAITMIAKGSGVRTVDVQAFFISSMPRYKGSLADSYCAITRDQLDLYRSYHQREAEQRLYQIGSLMMDNQLSAVLNETMESTRSEYGIALDKFVIFFAEQHGDGGYSFDIAENLISSLPASMYLIIKLHPRSPIGAVNNLVSVVGRHGKSSQVLVTQSGHLYKLIVASDVVVTQFSNVGLEAAVLRKKVLSVLISGDEPVLDFGALGIADVVYTLEDMISYINGLVYSGCSGTAPYLLSNPELGDGQSAHRVIEISRGMGFYHESTDKL